MDKKTADILDKWLLAAERLGASYEFYRVAKALETTLKAENMGMNTSQFIANVFKAAEQPHLDKRVQTKILSFIDTLPKEWRAKVPDEVVLRHIPAGKWDDFRPKNWVEENKLAAASLETAPEAEPKTNAWDQMVVSGSAGHQAFEFHYAAAPEKKFIGGYSSRRGEFYLLSGAKVLGCWASQPEYEQALAALPYEEIPAGAKPDRVISKIAVTFGKKICIGIRSGDGKLVFPGGHVEPGETPLEAAVRELAEETGISVQDYELFHLGTKMVVSPRGYLMEVHAYSMGVDAEVHTTVDNDPDGEVLKWLWVDYSAGLPKEVLDNLYVPLEKDYLLQALGLAPEASVLLEGAAFVMELSPHDTERMIPKEEKVTSGIWDLVEPPEVVKFRSETKGPLNEFYRKLISQWPELRHEFQGRPEEHRLIGQFWDSLGVKPSLKSLLKQASRLPKEDDEKPIDFLTGVPPSTKADNFLESLRVEYRDSRDIYEKSDINEKTGFGLSKIKKQYRHLPLPLLKALHESLEVPLSNTRFNNLLQKYSKEIKGLPKGSESTKFYRGINLEGPTEEALLGGKSLKSPRVMESWSSNGGIASNFGSWVFSKKVPLNDRIVYYADLLNMSEEDELLAKGQTLSAVDLDFLHSYDLTEEQLEKLKLIKGMPPASLKMINKALKKLKSVVRSSGQKQTVYRALNIKDKDSFLAEMANRGLGVFWASSEDKAVTYWGETSPTYVVLEAEITDEDVDKETTEELNNHPDYAGEDEVRLLPDRKILVKSATFHKRLSRKEMTDVIFGEAKKPAPEVVQVNKLLNTGSAD